MVGNAPLLRMLCVALAVWLGMRVGSAIFARDDIAVPDRADACRDREHDEGAPRASIRTRTPGLHRRFLTRDVVAPRAARQYQE